MASQQAFAYAARDASGHLSPFTFSRRATGPEDVTFKILYCGVCHSDLHQVRNEWQNSTYPMVPGHEMVGIVSDVGSNVMRFKVGDVVGVGCQVWACGSCDACDKLQEQYCEKLVWTYNDTYVDGTATQGGYCNIMVAEQKYVFRIPPNLPLDAAAPLLCAGITVYSPMKYYGMVEPGKQFGVVGLGGLGHMAVKFGKAFGMKVTVISTSSRKEKEAKELLGADHFLVSKDEKQMAEATKSLDYILDTVSAVHALEPLLNLLKVNGKMVMVGVPEKPLEFSPVSVVSGRRFVGGSLIGGLQETQEMLDFCGEHNITSTIEKISMDYVNTAMDRLHKSDVKYRFVIDVAGTFQKS